ncbi:bifunctional DNA primase/polymerase [Kribbella soli]|uniref:DNA primase/polymerase bifunctional N-terminal domain-containing protein n=1 Tax=Kribbella soli TaxID=1124743 RepID=A0A4R0GU67_9ACTN|nr:bifunctional DNA primase/polymerase [Kribbella soli]TCC01337.1 hypothetical protein E0H45_42210 [Kribbella soli]
MTDFKLLCDEVSRLPLPEAAVYYAERFGWYIFRLAPGTNVTMAGSHGHLDATRDLDQIREWWTEEPNANVGVNLKLSGLYVPDVDPRNDGAFIEEWPTFRDDGHELPVTLTQVTPGDGAHYFFSSAALNGSKLRATIGTGIDVKYNGYVALAPSCRPDGCYEWTQRVAPASSPVVDGLVVKTVAFSNDAGSATGGDPFPWAELKATDSIHWGSMTWGSTDFLGQDDLLQRAAASLRARQQTDSLALPILYHDLIDKFETEPGRREWTHEDADNKWNWAKEHYPNGPAPLGAGAQAVVDGVASRVAADDRNPLGFTPLGKIERKSPTWLVRAFLLTDAFGVIGGPEKALKSYIVIAVVLAVASGTPLFCDERFTVSQRGKVLVLTGEGDKQQFLDRLEHLCQLCDVDFDELLANDWVEVTDTIATTASEVFREGLRRRIEDVDPVLVAVDPAYVYVSPPDGAAGNVFTMGSLLADLRTQCRGRAGLVAHHMTKAGADSLSLSALTQAGFREVVDHWLLVAHAEDPDLVTQSFRLRVKCGARRGLGWDATFEITLGPLDLDTLRHGGKPGWRVLRGAEQAATQSAEGSPAYWRNFVYQEIRDAPFELTQKDLTAGDHAGLRRTALAWLKSEGLVRTEKRPGPNGERRADRYGPLLDLDLSIGELLLSNGSAFVAGVNEPNPATGI